MKHGPAELEPLAEWVRGIGTAEKVDLLVQQSIGRLFVETFTATEESVAAAHMVLEAASSSNVLKMLAWRISGRLERAKRLLASMVNGDLVGVIAMITARQLIVDGLHKMRQLAADPALRSSITTAAVVDECLFSVTNVVRQTKTSGAQMTAVPLNGRSFTDLLALQSGVVPTTSLTSTSVQDVGVSAFSPSGGLNPGTMSVNGQRESANSFMLNASDIEESVNEGTAVIPNLDSISEFRILTSNFDAEYGEFSGAQISVVTKAGTNAFHGDIFEFVRNTALDARNYFSPTRGAFDQNQFGGTIGGPIQKNKIFFFGDYQGTQLTQGVDTGQIPVPSAQDHNGNLSDLASSFVTTDQSGNSIPTSVSGPYLASLLSQKLGYTVTAGEPHYTPGCTSPSACVLPNAIIPQAAWSAPGTNLLKYIPLPNNANGTFSTSAYNQTLADNKGAIRLDAVTKWGMLNAYYFLDNWSQDSPYPLAQGGANVPGFNALNSGRAQLLALGDTKTFGSSAVNQFNFSYLRDTTALGTPVGGLGVTLASQGFVTGPGTPGIVPLSPKTEGVEGINFNNFSIGTNTNTLDQVNNTFQFRDSFSKVYGTHTVKLGAEWHYYQVNTHALAQFNGNFVFFGTETGSTLRTFC